IHSRTDLVETNLVAAEIEIEIAVATAFGALDAEGRDRKHLILIAYLPGGALRRHPTEAHRAQSDVALHGERVQHRRLSMSFEWDFRRAKNLELPERLRGFSGEERAHGFRIDRAPQPRAKLIGHAQGVARQLLPAGASQVHIADAPAGTVPG